MMALDGVGYLCGCVNVIFENGEGENIRFAKYPTLYKRGLMSR